MKYGYLALAAMGSLLATSALAQQQQYVTGQDGTPYCREFTQKVQIAGATRTTYGTSCMQPDGSWQIVSQQPQGTPISPPVYTNTVPPPPAAYPPAYAVAPAPYYAAPYPYYAPAPFLGVGIDVGHGWYHDGYHNWHR